VVLVKEIGSAQGQRGRQDGAVTDLLWDDVRWFFDPDVMGSLPDVCVPDAHETGMTASDSQAHMAGSEILIGLVDELLAAWDGEPPRPEGRGFCLCASGDAGEFPTSARMGGGVV
jgi:hypothetical protein